MASEFLNEFTISELQSLYKDKKRYNKLSTAKALILDRILGARGPFGGDDFDRVMDRLIGKPKQSVDVKTEIGIVQIVLEAAKFGSAATETKVIEHIEDEPIAIETNADVQSVAVENDNA